MADEFNSGLNWWDRTVAASSSSVLNNSLGAFGWVPGITDINARPSSVSATSIVFQDNPKLQIGAADFNMMGLGLSSQAMDWNQTFMRGEEHNLNTSNSTALYGLMVGSENQAYNQYRNDDQLLPNPQFSRNSPPKHGQLHFSNNAPFWNPSAMQTQFPTPKFDGKTKNKCEVGDSSTVLNKSGNETSSKRPRNETPSLPAFKVRKEKMGDRITALQQLVSPFGKTDTASVLSETIEYIKFFHDQVNVLSTPYKKNGAATQHQLNCEMSEELEEFKQDLRSRGLCLVPVSSTFPVTHESTMDFWTPTFR